MEWLRVTAESAKSVYHEISYQFLSYSFVCFSIRLAELYGPFSQSICLFSKTGITEVYLKGRLEASFVNTRG